MIFTAAGRSWACPDTSVLYSDDKMHFLTVLAGRGWFAVKGMTFLSVSRHPTGCEIQGRLSLSVALISTKLVPKDVNCARCVFRRFRNYSILLCDDGTNTRHVKNVRKEREA